MFYRITNTLQRAEFDFATRKIADTPPVELDPQAPSVLVSQLCHADLRMYLIAIKSLCQHYSPKKVFIVDDLSLTDADKETLRHHIDSPEIVPSKDFIIKDCPTGICWERLGFIAHLVKEYPVLQLDADTLTLGPIEEVNQCFDTETSFTIGSPKNHSVLTFQEAAKQVENSPGQHVQILTEKAFATFPLSPTRFYIRGCAAFAGFAKNSFSLEAVREFSTSLSAIVGEEKWREWGSDQICSNVMVANSPKKIVLPDVKYINYDGKSSISGASFVHFRGTHRFKNKLYQNFARSLISKLAKGYPRAVNS